MPWALADGSLCLQSPSASAKQRSPCRNKLYPGAASPSRLFTTSPHLVQRGGRSHCATTSSSSREARSDCKCHLEWQALQPDPSRDGAHGILATSHPGSQHSPAWGEERKKGEKKNQKLLPAEPNLRPMLRICLQNSAGHSKKAIPHRASRLWGMRMGQGAGAQVTEPVQALPWL